MKNLGEKGAWVYPVTAQIFLSTPISGTGKATNFKFGRCIDSVHATKSPLKIWEKRERGRIKGLPNFFPVSPIISGTGKAIRTSNFVPTFLESIGTKAHYKFREK